VPDVETRVLGAKLRYRPAKDQVIHYRGTMKTILTDANGAPLMTPQSLQLTMQCTVADTDSGGNNTYKRGYQELTGEGFTGVEGPVVRASVGGDSFMMGARGDRIEMMNSVAQSVQSNATNLNRLNQMRASQNERMNDRYMGGHGQVDPGFAPVTPGPREQAATYLNTFDPSQLGSLDYSLYFHFPEERLKSGSSWDQQANFRVFSDHLSATMNSNIRYQVDGMERTADGFMVKVRWETPVTATINNAASGVPVEVSSQHTGTYSGTALINYKDGFVQNVQGRFEIAVNSASGPLKLTADESINRF
jgi:hypothetical protein